MPHTALAEAIIARNDDPRCMVRFYVHDFSLYPVEKAEGCLCDPLIYRFHRSFSISRMFCVRVLPPGSDILSQRPMLMMSLLSSSDTRGT
jgi:hypothetical protein